MNSLLSVVRLLVVLAVINFASIAILVILKFNEWDIAATVVTCTFSIAIIGTELGKRGGYNLLRWFRCLLAAGIIIGGISGFFWFFHLIHKLGHYQGDLQDTLWTSVTIIVTFIISVYLVVTCYKTSTSNKKLSDPEKRLQILAKLENSEENSKPDENNEDSDFEVENNTADIYSINSEQKEESEEPNGESEMDVDHKDNCHFYIEKELERL
ncbi:hypothetical protein RN001_013905 [Aquatica leii]|uniref:Transmembrane protein n=1 Tax=Aquatica leii TaxID=1421715 RepID=A0AAN7SNX1_9COLE|nr:hypothetical protein RN001_013905 [Aquatica leii]